MIAFLVMFGMRSVLTKAYNLAESGYYVKTVSSGPMLLANIAYVCNEDDSEFIEEEDLRESFKRIVREIEQEELSYSYAEGGIIDRARFHEAGHEAINFDHVDPAIREVITNRYGIDESDYLGLMIKEDELCGYISKQLLPNILPKYLRNYLIIASMGYVRSIAVEKSILPIYALIMYIGVIGYCIYHIKKRGFDESVQTMMLVLIVISGTVLGTSLVIQCITRYMIYNFPFFYIAVMAMIKNVKES